MEEAERRVEEGREEAAGRREPSPVPKSGEGAQRAVPILLEVLEARMDWEKPPSRAQG